MKGFSSFILAVADLVVASAAGGVCNTIDTIEKLNKTVHGQVHINRPYSLPCFSSYEGEPVARDEAACARVQASYGSIKARVNVPGAYVGAQSEICLSDPEDQCELDFADPYNPTAYTNKTCRQGSIPPHYLEITNERDVQAAFKFSRATGTSLVVKNSGHDFLGHSSKKDGLALWTRSLRHLSLNKSFRPAGCGASTKPTKAITMGAGVNCGEAYRFARDNDVTILCGYAETVGLSGGWVQNGGHSVLSASHGLGVDRVLEFKVVTPDGEFRTANAHQNQDLFWALRGGGGNTFGVVLESTHYVDDNFPVVSIDIGFTSTSVESTLGFIQILVENAVGWGDLGFGGHIIGTSIVYLTPSVSLEEVKKATKPLTDYALARGGRSNIKQLPSFHGFYEEFITKNSAAPTTAMAAASRLVSRRAMSSKDGQAAIMDFFRDLATHNDTIYVPVDVPTNFRGHVANSTSVTPAWYESTWHITSGSNIPYDADFSQRKQAIDRPNYLTEVLKRISPETGSYMNEANPFTPDWQEAWWGQENYAALLAIKEKYDPNRLLLCWRCVGWRESDVPSSCLRAFNN